MVSIMTLNSLVMFTHIQRQRKRMMKQMWPVLTNVVNCSSKSSLNTSCNSFISWIVFQNKNSKNLKPAMTMYLRVIKSSHWPRRLCTIQHPVKSLTPFATMLLLSCSIPFTQLLEQSKHFLVLKPLYFMCSLPGMLFPQILIWVTQRRLIILLKTGTFLP